MTKPPTPKAEEDETRDLGQSPLDPLIRQAAEEVDQTLLDWSLSLSPRERLRACTNATNALGRFIREPSRTR